MKFPTPYTVQREPFTPGATNSLGDPVDAWGDPLDVLVHGWGPPNPDEMPPAEARDLVVRDMDLYVPPGTEGEPRDRWTLDGVVYDQVGHVQDYGRGPFGWDAGCRIRLVRAEG